MWRSSPTMLVQSMAEIKLVVLHWLILLEIARGDKEARLFDDSKLLDRVFNFCYVNNHASIKWPSFTPRNREIERLGQAASITDLPRVILEAADMFDRSSSVAAAERPVNYTNRKTSLLFMFCGTADRCSSIGFCPETVMPKSS